jgi:hypothetical protein
MTFEEIAKEAINKSPVKGLPFRTPAKRPSAKGTTGVHPNWNRKSFPVEGNISSKIPIEDDNRWKEISPGRYRFYPNYTEDK